MLMFVLGVLLGAAGMMYALIRLALHRPNAKKYEAGPSN